MTRCSIQGAKPRNQKNRAAFALGMLFGLLGTLPKLPTGSREDLFSALPLGLAVGGVRTSAGGTGPPLAKYRFLLRANFTCTPPLTLSQALPCVDTALQGCLGRVGGS